MEAAEREKRSDLNVSPRAQVAVNIARRDVDVRLESLHPPRYREAVQRSLDVELARGPDRGVEVDGGCHMKHHMALAPQRREGGSVEPEERQGHVALDGVDFGTKP